MKTHAFLSALVLLAACKDEEPSFRREDNAGRRTRTEAEPATRPPAKRAPPAGPQGLPAPPDVAAPPADAERTASGLATKVLQLGTSSVRPTRESLATVHYTGWQTNGTMFDSSVTRGEPMTFAVTGVIAGWTEALLLMTEGEKRRLWIPENLAYGGRPGPPSGMLVFDVELIEAHVPPERPASVSRAPRNAERTASRLASVVVRPGTGTRHPTPADRVEVHYSGWTTDGNMFDSSFRARPRGPSGPATFGVGQVIAGWTEGLQLMVEGERRVFWIPANLAYEGRPGPQGTLVFWVELRKIL